MPKKYYDLKYKDENHIHNIHEYGIDYLANEIYLVGNPEYIGYEEGEGGVEYSMASTFIKNLNILMRKSDHPILIHMILSAADKRVMMPHSTFMFHQGTFGTHGTTKTAITELEELKKGAEIMLDIYVDILKNSNGSMRKKAKYKIREWLVSEMNLKEDVYLTAKEAIELGFADSIFDGSQWLETLTNYEE